MHQVLAPGLGAAVVVCSKQPHFSLFVLLLLLLRLREMI
jgi:hypothetical protein